jgi:alpha-amylase
MQHICLYLHVHQPYRIKRYRFFDIAKDKQYFNAEGEIDLNNQFILEKVSNKSYLPTIKVLQKLLDTHPEFSFALSFSGTVLEQMQEMKPEVLEGFQQLVASGRVEILADTYHHSLAFFYSLPEFKKQVKKHERLIKKLFGYEPKVFRNTELSYRNDLGKWVDRNGYLGILAEGWDPVLGWRNANHVYHPPGTKNAKLLLKHYKLSDDIAFRFGQKSWEGWPLTAEKFASWVHAHHGSGPLVNLFMDFETFGEHQWEDTGIFDFLSILPEYLLRHPDTSFITPSSALQSIPSSGELDVPDTLTWADTERNLSAWTGNAMQQEALRSIYALEKDVLQTKDKKLIEDWRRMQTSDHFYYMCTKYWNDGDVHKYFSPYETPVEAYTSFMNALFDVQLRIESYQ